MWNIMHENKNIPIYIYQALQGDNLVLSTLHVLLGDYPCVGLFYLSIYISIYLYIYLYIYLSIYIYLYIFLTRLSNCFLGSSSTTLENLHSYNSLMITMNKKAVTLRFIHGAALSCISRISNLRKSIVCDLSPSFRPGDSVFSCFEQKGE